MIPPCYVVGWERKPHMVCGRVLQPFKLGHARTLYLAESPFVLCYDGRPIETPTTQDVLLAVAVCANDPIASFDELAELMRGAEEMKADDMAAETEKLIAYFRYWMCPHPAKTREASREKREPALPWPWQLATFARQVCGIQNPWEQLVSDMLIELAASCARINSEALLTLNEFDFAEKLKAEKQKQEAGNG